MRHYKSKNGKIKKNVNFFKSWDQSLIKFNDLEGIIITQLIPLITR